MSEHLIWALFALLGIMLLVMLFANLRQERRIRQLRQELAREESEEEELALKIWLSKKQLETAFDALSDRICVIDTDFTILRVNKSYADEVGRRIRAILGKKCHFVFFGRKMPCDNCPAVETLGQQLAVKERNFGRIRDGEDRSFKISTYPVADEEGKIVNIIEHVRDVTEEKRINDQLIRSEKLAGIGILTAGIAHEMNNPLSGISGTAENMLGMPEKFGLNDKGRERMATILECATRASTIMGDLLRLSQKQEVVRQLADLRQLLRKNVDTVRQGGHDHFQVDYSLEESLPRIRCDSAKLEQVFANVIKNAALAIADRRKKCRREGVEYEGRLSISARTAEPEIIIEISDNGIGIPAGAESKLFDPFFTTRPPGKGTGLGLSICHRIIEEHHGQISVVSRQDLTVATIILPISKDPLTDVDARVTTRRSGHEQVQNPGS